MMKISNQLKFEVVVASHYGMCFGVKAAIEIAEKVSQKSPVTILGELAHNVSVQRKFEAQGARQADLTENIAPTNDVIITAHGASDKDRKRWASSGYRVTDTTCPLVHKAHAALRNLVSAGYHPVVIGKAGHTEVRGLTGDFPDATVISTMEDVETLRLTCAKIGVISQTTQQLTHVEPIIAALRAKFASSEIHFIDTICRPTKDRQSALLELCNKVSIVIVVGGKNSNNTAQLADKCRKLGCTAYHVQDPDELIPAWFQKATTVGITAGTSTPDEDVDRVRQKLLEIAKS